MNIRVQIEGRDVERRFVRLQRGLSPQATRLITMRVATETLASLVRRTPRRFTGHTRKAWQIIERGQAIEVSNPTRTMLYLEIGTRAHGPVRARALFIPLTRRAFIGGYQPGMVFGRDFIYARRVRGITARRIVQSEVPMVIDRLRHHYTRYIQHLLR